MKKVRNQGGRLQLNMEMITNLQANELNRIRGGAAAMTGTCSDGCSPIGLFSKWNCTNRGCTTDCPVSGT